MVDIFEMDMVRSDNFSEEISFDIEETKDSVEVVDLE